MPIIKGKMISFVLLIAILVNICTITAIADTTGTNYALAITNTNIIDNTLSVSGEIAPAVKQNLVLTIENDVGVVGTVGTESEMNGKFEFSYKLPILNESVDYKLSVNVKKQEPVYQYLHSDSFDTGVIKNVLRSDDVVIDDSQGNPFPAMKIQKTPARNARVIQAISNIPSGKVTISFDFKKDDYNQVIKLIRVDDSTGNNPLCIISAKDKNVSLQYRKPDNSAVDVRLLTDYEIGHWYNVKLVADLDSSPRTFKCLVDDEVMLDSLPISDSMKAISRIYDGETANGTFYVDNTMCYIDTANYITVSGDSAQVFAAGTDLMNEALQAIRNSGPSTIESVLLTYGDRLLLDFEGYNKLSDKTNVFTQLAGKTYSSISEFKKNFNIIVAYAVVKETDEESIVEILQKNSVFLEINVPQAMLLNAHFKKAIYNNMKNVENIEELRNLVYQSTIFAEIRSATKLTIANVINNYADYFINIGLNGKYSNLTDAQADSVAIAVFDNTDDGSDIQKSLNSIIDLMNKKMENLLMSNDTSNTSFKQGQTSERPSYPGKSIDIDDGENGSNNLTFTDVDHSYWAYREIMVLAGKNIVNGVSGNRFMPDMSVTREAFTKMIVIAMGLELNADDVSFSDVNKDDWYYPYICAAVKNEIIMGKSEDVFGIGDLISREDAALILYRSGAVLNSRLEPVEENNVFADDKLINGYAKEAVYYLKSCGVINGKEHDNFQPQAEISRAESVKMLYHILYFQNPDQDAATSGDIKTVSAIEKAKIVLKSFDINPDIIKNNHVTRGEFANLLATALKYGDVNIKESLFDDIADSPYENAINYLASVGAIPTAGKYFYPDYIINNSEAIELAVSALGYNSTLLNKPYFVIAQETNLMDNLNVSGAEPLEKDNCAILLFNFINAPFFYTKTIRTDGSISKADSDYTIVQNSLGGYRIKGRITATEYAALNGQESKCEKDSVIVDGVEMKVGGTDINQYLGYAVEIYGKSGDDDNMVLCYFIMGSNDVHTIKNKDISEVLGFDSGDAHEYKANPSIKGSSSEGKEEETFRLASDFTIIYNGNSVHDMSDSDFYGSNGTVTFIDTKGTGEYDFVSIMKYKYYIVSNFDNVSRTIEFENSSLVLNINDINKNATYYKDGRTLEQLLIANGDVLCIYAEKLDNELDLNDAKHIVINVCYERITDIPTEISESENEVTIGGKTYSYAEGLEGDITVGKKQVFYLDLDRSIVKISDADIKVDYAYLLQYKNNGSIDPELSVKYMSTNNQVHIFPIKDKLKYTGYDENNVWQKAQNYNAKKMTKIFEARFTERMLVKLSVSDSEIQEIIMAYDETENNDYAGYDEDTFTLDGYTESLSSVNRIATATHTLEPKNTFVVFDYIDQPDDAVEIKRYISEDYNSLSAMLSVIKKTYIYDSTDTLAAGIIVVKIANQSYTTSNWVIYSDNVVVVESVSNALNDEGNSVYRIYGYSGGKAVTYTTEDGDCGEKYNTTWTQSTSKSLVSQLTVGDVIQVSLNAAGNVDCINILACVSDIGNSANVISNSIGNDYTILRTVTAPVYKSYDGKTIRVVGEEGKLYPVTGYRYIIDIGKDKITVVDKSVINIKDVYSNTLETADKVFIRTKKGFVNDMVIYRD